jgi:glycyl-tRNA synthetase beta chain
MKATLLIELFTEELPPRALQRLGDAFASSIASQLRAQGLAAQDGAAAEVHCTPRRLAAILPEVLQEAPARQIQLKGPSVAVGLDAEGRPTMALKKWAEKQGVAVDSLSRASDGKQECFYHHALLAGAVLGDVVEAVVTQALASLPIPKMMSYQLADGVTTVSFVRPAHRLVVLHGDRVLPCRVLGLDAGRLTEGHRFQGDGVIEIDSADSYPTRLLERGRVVSAFDARRERIDAALRERSRELDASLSVTPAEAAAVAALLDEVTALVEWPAVYVGRFEEQFLEVPQECLILTMRTNQKFFPLFDGNGSLLPKFLIVSNMDVAEPAAIIDGNERVVRPRLADARFFFDQDRKSRLEDRLPRLAEVVYHARLGSQAERSARVEMLAGTIAEALGHDASLARRAARLAKADLLTGMVGEFPELQGIMGRYYAQHDGEPAEVAQAIAEHYQPRYAGDDLPASGAGTVLALADKLETLAGIWGIGQRPTGEKDPFALRRHALGVVRMLAERSLPLELGWLVAQAFGAFGATARFDADVDGLHAFICDRLRGYLRERGSGPADVEAVLAVDAQRLDRTGQRLAALAEFRQLPQFEALAAANKRIANILRKSETAADGAQPVGVRPELLAEPAEAALHQALLAVRPLVDGCLQRLDFTGALKALADLREPVDDFFDRVMVNAPEPELRGNRLALLRELRHLMNVVVDLSKA